MTMTLSERLRALGQRREAEGLYTDQNICEAATDLVELAIKMREAQRKYFLTRDRNDLVAAKQLEREFDQMAI